MTDSSPGIQHPGTSPPLALKSSNVTDTSSSSSQPDSLPMADDHSMSSKAMTSHPLASDISSFECHKGQCVYIVQYAQL